MSAHKLIDKKRANIDAVLPNCAGDIVEVGTARPAPGLPYGESSTHDLNRLAIALGRRFTSIDLAPERGELVEPPALFIQGDGTAVMMAWQAPIFLLYLDNFDVINDPVHEENLRGRIGDFYERHDLRLTNQQSAYAHFAQARAALPKVSLNGFICLDDTIFDYWRNRWWGKGAMAVPYLLGMGCVIIALGDRGVLLQKVTPNELMPASIHPEKLLDDASFAELPMSMEFPRQRQ
ncbi:hypothetical protein [Sphingomonas sp. MMS24-J13]|uniref:hypothetical protein n=1 Tax=Sphingomonas sp. MMS24-J13 TaxID=3238686 RepID=UPI003850BF80